MKVIELKEQKINVSLGRDKEVEQDFSYADLLLVALNDIPQGGLLPTEMGDRIKIIDKVKSNKKKIELEDSELDLLYDLIKVQKFAMVHKALVEYREYFDKVKESK